MTDSLRLRRKGIVRSKKQPPSIRSVQNRLKLSAQPEKKDRQTAKREVGGDVFVEEEEMGDDWIACKSNGLGPL